MNSRPQVVGVGNYILNSCESLEEFDEGTALEKPKEDSSVHSHAPSLAIADLRFSLAFRKPRPGAFDSGISSDTILRRLSGNNPSIAM